MRMNCKIAFASLSFVLLGTVSLGAAAQGHGRAYNNFVVGQKVPDQFLDDSNVIKSYSHYHVRKPQDGYEWIRGTNDNVLLVSLKSHIINKSEYRPNIVPESGK